MDELEILGRELQTIFNNISKDAEVDTEIERVCAALVEAEWHPYDVIHQEDIPVSDSGVFCIGRVVENMDEEDDEIVYMVVMRAPMNLRSSVRSMFDPTKQNSELRQLIHATANSDLYVKWVRSESRLVKKMKAEACNSKMENFIQYKPLFEEEVNFPCSIQ